MGALLTSTVQCVMQNISHVTHIYNYIEHYGNVASPDRIVKSCQLHTTRLARSRSPIMLLLDVSTQVAIGLVLPVGILVCGELPSHII